MWNKFEILDPKEEFFFKKTSQTSISEVRLVGTEMLRVKWTKTTFQAKYSKRIFKSKTYTTFVSKKPVDENSKFQEFVLREVSVEELHELRFGGSAGFVLKQEGKLYYAEIPYNINLFAANICGDHKCCCGQEMCKRLSAASDEEGGCAKVRGRTWGIERYNFITYGCETFGTKHDLFVVAGCANYEKCPPKKVVSPEKMKQMRLDLALFMWDDVENIQQVQERKQRNHERNAKEAEARAKKARLDQAARRAKAAQSANGNTSKVNVAAKTVK